MPFDRWCEDRQIAALSSSVAFIPSHANARTRARDVVLIIYWNRRGSKCRTALYVRADPPSVKYMALRITRDVGPASVGNPTIRNFPTEIRERVAALIFLRYWTLGTYILTRSTLSVSNRVLTLSRLDSFNHNISSFAILKRTFRIILII